MAEIMNKTYVHMRVTAASSAHTYTEQKFGIPAMRGAPSTLYPWLSLEYFIWIKTVVLDFVS